MEYISAIEADMVTAQCKNAVREQIIKIPQGNDYHANRYDTDTMYKIHVWSDNGNSYDVEVMK